MPYQDCPAQDLPEYSIECDWHLHDPDMSPAQARLFGTLHVLLAHEEVHVQHLKDIDPASVDRLKQYARMMGYGEEGS